LAGAAGTGWPGYDGRHTAGAGGAARP